jgi:hypothetical protein
MFCNNLGMFSYSKPLLCFRNLPDLPESFNKVIRLTTIRLSLTTKLAPGNNVLPGILNAASGK